MTFTEFPVINIENGPIRGLQTKNIFGSEYYSHRGIPYMKPPLGKLRFREAENAENWIEPFDATQEGPSYCMTDFMTGVQDGQENSGTINVYRRCVKPNELLPVMIWIHGGGYCRGSSRTDLYGPDYLIEKDVVLVTFNYLLGAIGFLSLEDESLNVPGNIGLKDQVFALKWIQRNIHNFGGDSQRCTIFGESAGGACVHFLTITPQTEGLFQRAIIMSGSAFNRTWSFTGRNKQAQRLASILGWKGDTEKVVLEFLESVPAFELDKASNQLMSVEEQHGFGIIVPFAPVIEPYTTKNCIVHKEPIEMAREAWSNSIDVIVMGTSFEGLLRAFVEEEKAYELYESPSYFAPLNDLRLKPTDNEAIKFGSRIRDLYYGLVAKPSVANQEQYLKYSSDFHFWHGLHRVIKSRASFSSAKTYLLRFDVDADLNMFKALKKAQHYRGACHADDIFYLFTTDYHAPPSMDSREFQTIQRIVGIFTSFAVTGNPNCAGVSNLTIHPCIELDEFKCINITENNVTEVELPESNRLKVWDSVYEEHGVPLY